MVDLVEEVFDGAAGEVDAAIGEFAQQDEIAVPAVHLVEAAAGDDVAVGQIEQAGRGNLVGLEVAWLADAVRQMQDLHVALLLQGADGCG